MTITEQLAEALQELAYEVTHLSPRRADDKYKAYVHGRAVDAARTALVVYEEIKTNTGTQGIEALVEVARAAVQREWNRLVENGELQEGAYVYPTDLRFIRAALRAVLPKLRRGDTADTIERLTRERDEARRALKTIQNVTYPGSRTLDEMIRDMRWANDEARRGLSAGEGLGAELQRQEMETLKRERDEARRTLEWYADERNYSYNGWLDTSPIQIDGGKCARCALGTDPPDAP